MLSHVDAVGSIDIRRLTAGGARSAPILVRVEINLLVG
jgi:hypothetical protein